ncbi:MAG: type 4a pilus biogenesis protein PilO [Pirellulales bacterium]|nr:type 4a pilus biogenesis protein PilO [Pirellulales bacterium]
MNNPTVRRSNWILTLTLAAIAVAFLTLVWLPGRREILAIQEQVRAKRQFVNQAAALAKTLTATQKQLDTTEAAFKNWEKNAPRNKDLPSLYGKINALAKRSGLSVARFDPEPFVVHEEIREIPLEIGCTGTFWQVFDFLGEIETLPPLIWVDAMRLENISGVSGCVKSELNLVVFSGNPYSSDCIIETK